MNYGSEIGLNSSSILHPPSMCLIPSLLCIEVESFSISPSPSFLFSPPPDVSDSSSGTTLKLNQLHTHTPPNNCLYVISGLNASISPRVSLCAVLSSSLSLWSGGLAGPGIQFSCHPDASVSAQTDTHTQMDFLSWQFETNQTVVWERGQMRAKGHQGTPQHNRVQALDTHTHTHLRTNLQDAHHCYRHIWGKITCCIHLQWHIFYNLDNISFTLLSFLSVFMKSASILSCFLSFLVLFCNPSFLSALLQNAQLCDFIDDCQSDNAQMKNFNITRKA